MMHPDWPTPKLAYFAGLLTASMAQGAISAIITDLRVFPLGSDEFFIAFVREVKPFVTEDRWQGCIETVERFYR